MRTKTMIQLSVIAILAIVALLGILNEPSKSLTQSEWWTVFIFSKATGLFALLACIWLIKRSKVLNRYVND